MRTSRSRPAAPSVPATPASEAAELQPSTAPAEAVQAPADDNRAKALVGSGASARAAASRANRGRSPVATLIAAQTQAAVSPALDLTHLRQVNPQLDRILAEQPGVAKFLEQNKASIFDGKLPAGDALTRVDWTIWNHSELTSKGINGFPAYGHGMKDDDILNQDVLLVWQQPAPGKSQSFTLQGRKVPGEIIGVYQLRDLVDGQRWADGGFSGRMTVVGHGASGQTTIMAWATVSIRPDGAIAGGGFPDMQNGVPVAYQQLEREQRKASGAQYEGRAAEIVHGAPAYVPLVVLE